MLWASPIAALAGDTPCSCAPDAASQLRPATAAGSDVCWLAVQLVDSDEQAYFVEQLEPNAMGLIMDPNGNHVVQRCLQKMPPARTEMFHRVVIANCLDVAKDRHGCCVLQRCMDFAAAETKRALLDAVARHGLELAQHAYGNYVVQVRYVWEVSGCQAAAS